MLDKDYKQTSRVTYKYARQKRTGKAISSIEDNLIKMRDSTGTLKFNGNLEAAAGSATEIGKERFVAMLKRRVVEHGHETFFHIRSTTDPTAVVSLFEHSHYYKLDAVVAEFMRRFDETNTSFESFDQYELDDITLSRLVVESLLTSAFYEKIVIRFNHRTDFEDLPGSCLFLMALDTCNASALHDVAGAKKTLEDLSLDSYPGENVSDFLNEAQRLIKIMLGDYALPVCTGSDMLDKLTKTSSEYFNRKIHGLLDLVMTMEHKYKLSDPKTLISDPDYHLYGPLALIGNVNDTYGRWPALATKLPQSNHASKDNRATPAADVKCFRCQGPHHIKDCPKKGKPADSSKEEPDAKKPKKEKDKELPAWRYLEPKDLTKALKDGDGREWKFCTKCKCKKSQKIGVYQLSHFDAEHVDTFVHPNSGAGVSAPVPTKVGNLAAVNDPSRIPSMPYVDPPEDYDSSHDVTFMGAWCTSVDTSDDRPGCLLCCDYFDHGLASPCPMVEHSAVIAARPLPSDILPCYCFGRTSHATSEPCLSVAREITHSTVFCLKCEFCHGELLHTEYSRCPIEPLRAGVEYFEGASKAALSECSDSSTNDSDSDGILPTSDDISFDSFDVDDCCEVLSAVLADLETARLALPLDRFEACYTDLPIGVEFEGITFYDPEPPDDLIDPGALMRFLTPAPALNLSTIFLFWITTLFWDTLAYLFVGPAGVFSRGPSRTYRRRLAKRRTPFRPLSFLPITWMVMTTTVMLPIAIRPALHHLQLPSFSTVTKISRAATFDILHRVLALDRLVSLEYHGSWSDYNHLKGAQLYHDLQKIHQSGKLSSVASSPEVASVSAVTKSSPKLDLLNFPDVPLSTTVDCVAQLKRRHIRRLLLAPQANIGSSLSLDSLTTPPSVFMAPTHPLSSPNIFMAPTHLRKPVIFDTGASLAITPDKLDFDGPLTVPKGDLRLGGMANGLRIEGVGPVTWTFANSDGTEVRIRSMAYHVPGAKARLLSPQRLFDPTTGVRGKYEGDHNSFRLYIDNNETLTIEYDDRNSLPIGYAIIGDISSSPSPQMNLTLHDESNQNLTAGQKLLLHWHQRFGHLNLPAVQRIFRAVPFLSATFESASKCDMRMLKCETCEYAKGHRRAKQSTTAVPVADHVGALKVDHLKPGTQVSVDHFESRLLGRTFDSYGKASSDTYKGGCIFVDHGTGYMHVEHQLGFSAVETVRAKQNFELMAVGNGVLVESYLTDSGAFSAAKFVKQIREHSQRIRYCGANAHHKNGVAERGVQKVSNMARAMLLHSAAHWKDGIDSSLWPMAVSYATHLYNHLPNDQGLCPANLFTGSTVPCHRLRDLHVCGCPVYVLDPQLQAGQKLPRWQPRSRRGVFLGFSSQHSSEVPLVLNLQTGSITPQYHVVFDDHFSTVTSVAREEDPPGHWDELCLEHTTYIHTESSASDTIAYLEDDWLTPPERVIKERQLQRQDTIRRTYDPLVDQPPAITMPIHDINGDPVSPLKGAPAVPVSKGAPVGSKGAPAVSMSKTSTQKQTAVAVASDSLSDIPPPLATRPPNPDIPTVIVPDSNVRRSARSTKGKFQTPHFRDQAFLSSIDRFSDPDGHEAQLAYLAELFTCSDTGTMDVSDPRAYAAKQRGGDADNPTFQQAMNGPAADEYITAMKLEVDTLVAQRTWDPVPRTKAMNVLKGTWAFKLKRLPDGTAYRYKARFCARGDLQKEGVDFFETYAPVVQWSTIRLLLTTVLTEGWVTRQVDYTNAFVQAELKEEVYMEYPRMFGPKSGIDCVLKLRKSLYGLRQAPRTFFEKLKAGLEERNWKQSAIDPCLFLKRGLICVVYVDDTIFAGADVPALEREITALGISTKEQRHTFHLRNEGSVSAFLGIQIEKTGPSTFHLTQTGLIAKVLAATNMTNCNGCDTPATSDPLHVDTDGEIFDETWRYDSIIGMLMYLASNTRPDIAYAVHQAARFTHNPRRSHANGIKRILRYLKKTHKEGLIMQPTSDMRVDCYVDADFAGLFSVEDKQDPISVKSRTGYVIMYRGAPLHWVSKMQTQIALSTMEAEYIALSQSMRDLIPIREVLKEIMEFVFEREPTITYHSHAKAFVDTDVGTMKHSIPQSTVYEDNEACLKFARMPKLTPRTKHIGVPYHWFRSQVERLEIRIEPIDTSKQLGDQFTKGLTVDLFRLSRKVLMGW